MRRLPLLLAALALAAVGSPAVGAPRAAVPGPPAPGPGYVATDNVSWLGNIAINTDSAGARIVGKHLYITEDRGLTIYDISDPELPSLLSFLPVPQKPYYTEEDVDTNGKVLLIGGYGTLNVIDVRNPKAPKVTFQLAGADDHTISCVLDCQYAYGNSGLIVDLTDPEGPEVKGDWAKGTRAPEGGHDVTEVAPGLVVTSSNPVLYLDARKNPLRPAVIATGALPDDRYMHGNLWPRGGKDRWLIAGSESRGNCTPDAGGLMTFDTRGWERTRKFRLVDDFRLGTGLPTDGNSPYDQYCAHWFSAHPRWRDGGLLAMGWYEHGTRFFDVARKDGTITELGWFAPVGGSTSAAYWVTDEIVYAVDYQRGIDILRFSGKPSSRVVTVAGTGAGAAPKRPAGPRVRFEGATTRPSSYVCPVPA
ncbi:MAG TPA: hypothetical protein VNA12_09765 [Mycobacteriales bacterium]|nr:hypothetical protein [Mycobacteriales bacterium]